MNSKNVVISGLVERMHSSVVLETSANDKLPVKAEFAREAPFFHRHMILCDSYGKLHVRKKFSSPYTKCGKLSSELTNVKVRQTTKITCRDCTDSIFNVYSKGNLDEWTKNPWYEHIEPIMILESNGYEKPQ